MVVEEQTPKLADFLLKAALWIVHVIVDAFTWWIR
jgi:hypothetical protein